LIYFKTNKAVACSDFYRVDLKSLLLALLRCCLALLNHDNRLEQSLQRSSFNINSIECTALQLLTTLYFFLGLHQQLNIHFIYMLLMYMLHTRTHVYIIFTIPISFDRSRSTLSLHVLALYNRAGKKGES
jgi:small-conductance mechanosensitive channel